MATNTVSKIDYKVIGDQSVNSMEWRSIGPHRGGRTVAVAGDPVNPLVFYFGGSGGGVWKTHDAGIFWQCVSDGFLNTGPIGAIAVSDSDPKVLYVGTGEALPRPDVSYGDGVYKSSDGGNSWIHVGLEATRHISRIRIHPQNPDLVYVAAQGDLFDYNKERGVYRSKDGGTTWELVLFKSDKAGAIDLSMDPSNPSILYAAIFQFIRQPWTEISGGPDSGLYKSTDGGDTWTDISDNPGLPKGIKGRIGVAISPAKPERVWALIEAEDGALFRSDNGGRNWEVMTDKRDLRRSASSYMHIFPDTKDPDTIYTCSYSFWKSTDSGRTFDQKSMPHGDHHDLWIDPRNPDRMIEGSDGGGIVTLNGGISWSSIYNQPTHSFFHLAVDNQFPYRVYGTPMDNSAISVPSRTFEGAIPWKDCYPVGTAESGHIVVRPDNSNIVIAGGIGSSPGGGGNLLRYDHSTGQTRIITVWPEDQYGSPLKDVKYRFPFTYPLVLSVHDPEIMYVAANKIFKSCDQGSSWEIISPDLTTQDYSKMQTISGGPITSAGLSSQYSNVIYALAESPHQSGVLIAGTDDSHIHMSRDDGDTWQDVSPHGLLPEWTCISTIEISSHDPGTIYVAAHRYKLGDHRPFLIKSVDHGKTWQNITDGIGSDEVTRVIREDPMRDGLLYVGTETGVYVSFDSGNSWQSLQLNLPAVPVHDLKVKECDLVAATHGRAFWILDDLTPLHQVTESLLNKTAHLFHPRDTYRINRPLRWRQPSLPDKNYDIASGGQVTHYQIQDALGRTTNSYLDSGNNPPFGVSINYFFKETPTEEVRITILDNKGYEIKSVSNRPNSEKDETISSRAGMNNFVWDLRYPNAEEAQKSAGLSAQENPKAMAPLALPGTYKARLSVGDQLYTEEFKILIDPRIESTKEDLVDQFDLHIRIRDKLSETNAGVDRVRSIRRQLENWEWNARHGSSEMAVSTASAEIKQKLYEVESVLTRVIGNNPMNLPPKGLDLKWAALTSVVGGSDYAPTSQASEVYDDFAIRTDAQLAKLQEIIDVDLKGFIDLIKNLKVPPIV